MPDTTTTVPTIAEAVAAALGEGRTTVSSAVVSQAHRRQDDGQAPVALRQSLDPRAGTEGRAAHLLAAVAEAGLLADSFTPRPVRDLTTNEVIEVLTKGQRDVLTCAARGLSYTETAEALHLSVSTVKGHVGAYYKKLGVHSVPEAVIAAVRCAILPRSLFGVDGDSAEAPVTRNPEGRMITCAHEGCTKRTKHESGLCRDHREG